MAVAAALLLATPGAPTHALDNGLARTPPMGFNPWNCAGITAKGTPKLPGPLGRMGFDEAFIKATADVMAREPLRSAGCE